MLSRRGIGATHMVNGVTVFNCQKQVWSWRLLKAVLRFLTPSCNHNNFHEVDVQGNKPQRNYRRRNNYYRYLRHRLLQTNTTTFTGTMFGYRRGKVSFCIQANSNSIIPLVIIELAIPTAILAKEMKTGLLRIALESCNSDCHPMAGGKPRSSSCSLLSTPVWNMYCNGRKVGLATKRVPTPADRNVLRLMKNMAVGVGTIDRKTLDCDDELMYLRGNFERVSGSSDSESFHLINPDGSTFQELSIFFLRSR